MYIASLSSPHLLALYAAISQNHRSLGKFGKSNPVRGCQIRGVIDLEILANGPRQSHADVKLGRAKITYVNRRL
jgi:hypothetical protein